jgi:hypothetical protein
MPITPPLIETPGQFVPAMSVSFGDTAVAARFVSEAHPLPVRSSMPTTSPQPLTGLATAGEVVGPYQPALGPAL